MGKFVIALALLVGCIQSISASTLGKRQTGGVPPQPQALTFQTEFYKIYTMIVNRVYETGQCYAQLYLNDPNAVFTLDEPALDVTGAPLDTESPAPAKRSAEKRQFNQGPFMPQWQVNVINTLLARLDQETNRLDQCSYYLQQQQGGQVGGQAGGQAGQGGQMGPFAG